MTDFGHTIGDARKKLLEQECVCGHTLGSHSMWNNNPCAAPGPGIHRCGCGAFNPKVGWQALKDNAFKDDDS